MRVLVPLRPADVRVATSVDVEALFLVPRDNAHLVELFLVGKVSYEHNMAFGHDHKVLTS